MPASRTQRTSRFRSRSNPKFYNISVHITYHLPKLIGATNDLLITIAESQRRIEFDRAREKKGEKKELTLGPTDSTPLWQKKGRGARPRHTSDESSRIGERRNSVPSGD